MKKEKRMFLFISNIAVCFYSFKVTKTKISWKVKFNTFEMQQLLVSGIVLVSQRSSKVYQDWEYK